MNNAEVTLYEIKGLVLEGLTIEGSHHKQWYLEQILSKVANDPETALEKIRQEYWIEEGIAP